MKKTQETIISGKSLLDYIKRKHHPLLDIIMGHDPEVKKTPKQGPEDKKGPPASAAQTHKYVTKNRISS